MLQTHWELTADSSVSSVTKGNVLTVTGSCVESLWFRMWNSVRDSCWWHMTVPAHGLKPAHTPHATAAWCPNWDRREKNVAQLKAHRTLWKVSDVPHMRVVLRRFEDERWSSPVLRHFQCFYRCSNWTHWKKGAKPDLSGCERAGSRRVLKHTWFIGHAGDGAWFGSLKHVPSYTSSNFPAMSTAECCGTCSIGQFLLDHMQFELLCVWY